MADSIFKQMGVVIRNSLDSLKTELTTEINTVNTNITSKLDNLQNYTLPVATNTTLGGVKAGDNVTIDANGVISSSGSVTSVAGKTGVITLVKSDVGLNNVDNTSDISKNVLSATKLETARTIGGVSFNGTANINLPGVNTAGNQSTTGNSATATKLATPVKINNKFFDGSTNINLEEDAMVVKEKVVNLTGDVIQTSLGSVFIKTITENTTLTLTTSYNTGEVNSFILELINGGDYTINWWSDVKWDGGVAPELTNNGKDILGFYSYGSPRVTVGVVLSKDVK
jgi:ribosomal protein L21E